MIEKESLEQMKLIEWCELMKNRIPQLAWIYHVPNGEKRDYVTAAKLKKMGVKAGVPDLVLPVSRRGYHGLYIEMKVDKNKPSEKQRKWISHLMEEGYLVKICYGFSEASSVLLEYLGEK